MKNQKFLTKYTMQERINFYNKAIAFMEQAKALPEVLHYLPAGLKNKLIKCLDEIFIECIERKNNLVEVKAQREMTAQQRKQLYEQWEEYFQSLENKKGG